MHLAHEISENGDVVAYVGVTLPEQVQANQDALSSSSAVRFLGLVCEEADLRSRILTRPGWGGRRPTRRPSPGDQPATFRDPEDQANW